MTKNFATKHFTPHPIETVADALVILDHVVEQDIAGAPASFLPAPFGQCRTLHRRQDRAREGVFADTLNAGENGLSAQEDGNFLLVLRCECRRGAEIIVTVHRNGLGTLVERGNTRFLTLNAVRFGVRENRHDRLAEQTAPGIPIINGDQRSVGRRPTIGFHPPRRGGGKAELNLMIVRLGGRCGGKTKSQSSRCHQ